MQEHYRNIWRAATPDTTSRAPGLKGISLKIQNGGPILHLSHPIKKTDLVVSVIKLVGEGLIVMLHGCNQTPDDFAVGTKKNAMAEKHGLAIA